jgi:D-alanyl-D-alanine carboxypeptidase
MPDQTVSDRSNLLSATLDSVLASGLVPGGVVGSVIGDQTAIRPFGVADKASGDPVRPWHRFEIGSISKSFTALTLLSLRDEGRVDLDHELTRYLPWVEVAGEHPPFTLRHLLQHSAGLVMGSDAWPDDLAQAWTLRDTTTGSVPGTFFHYSNVGFMLLGLVIETLTGDRVGVAVTERVLTPAGMTDAVAQVTDHDRATMATGHQPLHEDRPLLPGDPLAAATWFEVAAADGNVAATGADMAAYAQTLLAAARGDHTPVVSSSSYQEMTSSLGPGGEPAAHWSRYGLGINIEEIEGRRLLTHGGGMVGYSSFLIVDPDHDAATVVLTNGPGDGLVAQWLARVAHDLLVAEQPSTPELFDPYRIPDAADYTGRWTDESGSIEVSASGDGLVVDQPAGAVRVCRLGHGLLDGGWFGIPVDPWRTFAHHADPATDTWCYGPRVLRRGDRPPADAEALSPSWAAVVGHFRSFSPWLTHVRVVAREGRLHLIADNGVEADKDQSRLVELAAGHFRIGEDPRLPERLRVGPVVDGKAVWIDLDGCRYTRTFTA